MTWLRRMLARFRQLSNAERWLFLKAYARIFLIDLELRRHGFAYATRRSVRFEAGLRPTATADQMARARCYARWLEAAARYHVVRAHCLHRALTLHQWLREDGVPSEPCIGVRRDGRELRAHAWVELGGDVVNDDPSAVATFIPLRRLSTPPAATTADTDGSPEGDLSSFNMRALGWQ